MKVTLLAYTTIVNPNLAPDGNVTKVLDKILSTADYDDSELLIEYAGRLCYNSTDKLGQAPEFIQKRIAQGHEDIIEHASASFLIEGISRTCLAQITRHRLFSYSVSSMRYIDANDAEWKCVIPSSITDKGWEAIEAWECAISWAEAAYTVFRELGIPKGDARFILPLATETSLVMTGNFRAWRHFLKLRLDKAAQWEIRNVALAILAELRELSPKVFGDILSVQGDTE